MKTLFRLSVLVLVLGFGAISAFASHVALERQVANSAESARVIRDDKLNFDLLVERQNGELWVLQHNPLCSSMTTEFPVSLILSNGKIDQLKVSPNEICKVYNSFRYSGEALMAARVTSENELVTEHSAELAWSGKRYLADYGTGCREIREFVGNKVYLSLPSEKLEGGTLQLPNNRGQCVIKSAKAIGVDETPKPTVPPKLEGLEYQAQNNQVYFYWKPLEGEKPLYLISHSKFKLDTGLYAWKSMPNVKVAQKNTITVTQLANKQKYYFYVAALGKDNVAGEWTEVTATPVSPGGLKNNPDPEPYEVKVTEGKTDFKLAWPSKDTIRKFRITLYVGGKLVSSSLVSGTTLEYIVPKKAEYKDKGLRFTVRSLNKTVYDPSYFDGVYWEYKAK